MKLSESLQESGPRNLIEAPSRNFSWFTSRRRFGLTREPAGFGSAIGVHAFPCVFVVAGLIAVCRSLRGYDRELIHRVDGVDAFETGLLNMFRGIGAIASASGLYAALSKWWRGHVLKSAAGGVGGATGNVFGFVVRRG